MEKRFEYIDIFRGFGIIFMILGHITFFSTYDHYIHAFHMPLFFFVSGFFFNTNLSFIDTVKKNTKKLLFPYFVWSIVFSIIALLLHQDTFNNIVLQVFTVNNNGFPIAGALWFLTSFYFSQLLLYVFRKVLRKDLLVTCFVFIVMLIGMNFYKWFHIKLFWSLDTSFVGLSIIWIGYLVNKYNIVHKVTSANVIFTIILFIINCVMIMNTGYVNMRIGSYPNFVLFLFNCFTAFIVYINISKILAKYFVNSKITNLLLCIGKNSIVSLCLNQFIIFLINNLMNLFKLKSFILNVLKFPSMIVYMINFVITILILYFLSNMLMSKKIKILFGK